MKTMLSHVLKPAVAVVIALLSMSAASAATPAEGALSPSAGAIYNSPIGQRLLAQAQKNSGLKQSTPNASSAIRALANSATPAPTTSSCSEDGILPIAFCHIAPGDTTTSGGYGYYCGPVTGGSASYYPSQVSFTLHPYGAAVPTDVSYSFPSTLLTGSPTNTLTISALATAVQGETYLLVITGTPVGPVPENCGPVSAIVQITIGLGDCCQQGDNGSVGDTDNGDTGQVPSLADDINDSFASDIGPLTLSGAGSSVDSGAILPGSGHVASSTIDYNGPGLLQIGRSYYGSSSALGNEKFVYPLPFAALIGSVTGSTGTATVTSPSGFQLGFTSADGGNTWTTEGDANAKLSYSSTPAANGAVWTLTSPDDSVTQYGASFSPITYTARGGASLSYSNQYTSTASVQTVTDNFGRALVYSTNSTTGALTVTTPGGGQYQYSYSSPSNGQLTQVTFPDGSTRKFGYTPVSAGSPAFPQISQIIDENNVTYQTFTYDNFGRATSTQLAGGVNQYSVSYAGFSAGAYQQSVTDPLGTARTFSFQDNGSRRATLNSTSLPCNSCGPNIASKIVGENGQITQTQDFLGNVKTYSYDYSRNVPTTFVSAAGTSSAQTMSVSWSPSYRVPVQISQTGRTTTLTYDNLGNLLSKTITDTASGNSRTWSYTYNGFGQRLTTTDANGNVTKYAYDSSGNLASLTDALGHVTSYQHDGDGHVTQKTDPNGLVTTYTYDPRGRPLTKTAGSLRTSITYDPAGNLTSIAYPSGYGATFSYDAAHRLTGMTDVQGNRIAYTLDNAGNRTGEARYNPGGTQVYTHTRAYDNLSRLVQDIGASRQVTSYQYDANSNLTQLSDPLSHATQYSYDSLNRLTQITAPDGGATVRAYNALNQLTGVTDPRRLNTSYGINALGDVLQTISPDSGTAKATFDAAGNVASRTDAKGQLLLYQYDALNRPTKVTRSDSQTIVLSYDQGSNGIGHLTGMTDLSGSTTWSYDANGHMTQKMVVISGQAFTTSYTYDPATGHLLTETLPSGKVVGYSWTNGQITALTLNNSPLVSNIVYQPFSGPVSWTFANGEVGTRSYDQDGRIIADPVETVAYDSASRVSGWTLGNLNALTGSRTYGYDANSRLTAYTGTGGPISYGYDASGNRQTQTVNGTSTAYTVDPGSNHITSRDSKSLTYDANGSLTALGSASLSYDVQGRLSAFNLPLLSSGSYLYNGNGQRVRKTAGSTTTLFAYDESGHLIGEYSGSGSVNEETIYLGAMPVAVTKPLGTFYVHADYRNAPRQIDNSNKTPVWEWDPTPFGDNQPNEHPSIFTLTFNYNLRFPGQYYDSESTASNNLYRDYYPSMGRYVESDPIGLAGGINTYGYVGGNPIGWVDPSGLNWCDVQAANDYLKNLFPDLDHPPIVYSYDIDAADYGKYYDGYIVLPGSDVSNTLNEGDFSELVNTIYHETLHANDSLLGPAETYYGDLFFPNQFGLGPHHQDITNQANNFESSHAGDIQDLYNNTRSQCGCGQ